MSLEVNGAIGGPWEKLGEMIVASGQEDASGFRRMLAEFVVEGDFDSFRRAIPSATREQFDRLRPLFL